MWGRCPIGSRYTKAGGQESWRSFGVSYASPRMTQAATSHLPANPFPPGTGEGGSSRNVQCRQLYCPSHERS